MAKPKQVYLNKICMDRVIRTSKSPQVQNLYQNFKCKLVTTQVTMSRTNKFFVDIAQMTVYQTKPNRSCKI